MSTPKKIHGNTFKLTAIEAVHLLEASVCEGISTPKDWETAQVEHVFGRTCNQFTSNDLSFVLGVASNGLRTSGFLQGDDLVKNLGQISALARQHIGAVIHVVPNAVPKA